MASPSQPDPTSRAPSGLTDEPYIDDGALRRALNWSAVAIMTVVSAVLLWSLVTPVDEVARAPGAMVPVGQTQIVDAQDGGLIREMLVAEGMKVKKGERMLRFDRVRARADLAAATAKKVALEIELEVRTAFIEDREPDLSRYAKDYPGLVERATGALQAERDHLAADVLVVEQQMASKHAQLSAIEVQLPAYKEEIDAIEKSRNIIEGLTEKGLGSQLKLADLIEQDARARRALSEAEGQRIVTQGQLEELTLAIASRRKKAQMEQAEKRTEAGAEYRRTVEEIADLTDRVKTEYHLAPVTGVIQSLPKPRVGQVINPSEMIAEIVPSGEQLVFDARLSPRDIGFVAKGQLARVKVDAYDFSRYGALEGVVDSISATTVADPHGAPYYRIRIRLDKARFRDDENLDVQAGMTGEVSVRTGSKTVFQYLWKPIYTNLNLAMSER
jgi:HlyD family secretion protein/adhesin transport system membrane fusion protein